MCELVPADLKNAEFLKVFDSAIKMWEPKECLADSVRLKSRCEPHIRYHLYLFVSFLIYCTCCRVVVVL